jgi:hypothetical protein
MSAHRPASEKAREEAAAVYRAILDDPERAAAIRAHRKQQAQQQATEPAAPAPKSA